MGQHAPGGCRPCSAVPAWGFPAGTRMAGEQNAWYKKNKPTAGNGLGSHQERRITLIWQIQLLHAFGLTNPSLDAVFFPVDFFQSDKCLSYAQWDPVLLSLNIPQVQSVQNKIQATFLLSACFLHERWIDGKGCNLEHPGTMAEKGLTPIPGLGALRAMTWKLRRKKLLYQNHNNGTLCLEREKWHSQLTDTLISQPEPDAFSSPICIGLKEG